MRLIGKIWVLLVVWAVIPMYSPANAGDHWTGLFDGRSLEPVSVPKAVRSVVPGSIVIISEVHDSKAHHENQKAVLHALAGRGMAISVGLEFFEARFQPQVDQYVAGQLPEADFLRMIQWGTIPFDLYREQALFPKTHNGFTIALNASRVLTGKIARSGLSSLSPEEAAEIPPGFELGSAGYRERFEGVMGNHVPAGAMDRYFQAQSVWDDTMAYTARQWIQQNPEQVLVVLVGDFHASYGGGLPDRLKARGQRDLMVISQVDISRLSEQEREAAIGSDPKWGVRSDFVWATVEPGQRSRRMGVR